jgi:hypothetical protein
VPGTGIAAVGTLERMMRLSEAPASLESLDGDAVIHHAVYDAYVEAS